MARWMALGPLLLLACLPVDADEVIVVPSMGYADEPWVCRDWEYDEAKCLELHQNQELIAEQRRHHSELESTARRDAAARAEAEGLALTGDGHNLGRGWWCFYDPTESAGFGECRRSVEACGARLEWLHERNRVTNASRCVSRRTAECFETAPGPEEPRAAYCFPDAELCDQYERAAKRRNLVAELGRCKTYR